MNRMRTIDAAAAYFREIDPDTAFTKTALRRLVITGQLPHVRVGNKYLVSLEVLESFLEDGGRKVCPSPISSGTIRPIREVL